MARSLNRVQLIGNLTRDPELRYTPSGAAVCSFGLATNRNWNTETGEKREEVEFHSIVAWNKLAELCSQFLTKGRKVYVEGRLATRSWTAQDGTQKTRTEIVIDDMILLDNKGRTEGAGEESGATQPAVARTAKPTEEAIAEGTKGAPARNASQSDAGGGETKEKKVVKKVVDKEEPNSEEVVPEDIPF